MRAIFLRVAMILFIGLWCASASVADDCADALKKVDLTIARPPDAGTEESLLAALNLCPSSSKLFLLIGDYYEHWSRNDVNPERQAYFNYLATEHYARGTKSGNGDEVAKMRVKLAALESETEDVSEVRIRSIKPYARLNVRVFFEFNSSELTKGAQEQLDVLGQFLAEAAESRIVLEGHTDIVGSEQYNMALSKERAESAKDYLVRMFGITDESIETIGYGFERLADIEDPYSATNRRVRIRKLPY